MGDRGGVFSCENTPGGHTETHNFFPYKQVEEMVIMNDLDWPILSYYLIYYEKVMQWTEKEALNVVWFGDVLSLAPPVAFDRTGGWECRL